MVTRYSYLNITKPPYPVARSNIAESQISGSFMGGYQSIM